MPDRRDRTDGWARLTRDQAEDRAASIAMAAIEQVLAERGPEERAQFFARWDALSKDEQRDLIKAVVDEPRAMGSVVLNPETK